MKTTTVPIPIVGAIAATRAILGIGIGLLLSAAIPEDRRKALGFTLLGIGVVTTVPLLAKVFGGARQQSRLTAGS
jgi:hypothetical protein